MDVNTPDMFVPTEHRGKLVDKLDYSFFEAESSKSFGLFGGGSLIMIGTVITAASFAPSLKRNATQNQDNIKFVGDADIQTTEKAEVRVKKCIYCGSEMQHDQVKCHSCGASRTAKK